MPLKYTRKEEREPRNTEQAQPNNPLHGMKLADIVTQLSEHYGWEGLGQRIKINCFLKDPSVKSSLKFLRKTPWAREKVEQLWVRTFR
ncbi:MAG: VF530 family protein [Bacteroidota bacterium]